MNTIFRGLRRHIHFFVIVPILIIVMTWPTIAHVHVVDPNVFWLPSKDIDANMLFWDAWYFKLLIAGQADYYFTELLFHPQGVSLAFHNFSLPHMILFAGLQTFRPDENAFNLTFLVLVYLNALSGYIFLFHVFRDKWISLFGAVVFGMSGFILARPAHPNIWFVATLPLSLYFFHRGILERRWSFMFVAGTFVGVTAFIGMYMLVCLLLMLMLLIVFFALSRWRDASYWLGLLAMFLVAAPFLVLRFTPMIVDSDGLSSALSKREDSEENNDLLAYFVNFDNPVTGRVFESIFGPDPRIAPVYLGYIPILLVIFSMAGRKHRSDVWLWLLLLVPFLILRLGSTLTINDIQYENIVLPKYLLTELFPHIFKPFWSTDNFQAGVLLPFAVLTCFGLTRVVQSIPTRYRSLCVLAFVAVVAFEYYQEPNPKVIPRSQLDFIDWLQSEPEQETIHLINLPMGGQQSKVYGFYQTLSGYRHVEGRPTRTPSAAFRFIDSSFLLSAWRQGESVQCFPGLRSAYLSDLNRLVNDGFTHVIVHHQFPKISPTSNSFLNVPTAYEDKHVTIYRLEDLSKNCEGSLLLLPETARQLSSALRPSAIIPERGLSILWVHPPLSVPYTGGHEFTATLYSLEHTIRFAKRDGGGFRAQGSGGPLNDADGLLNWRSMILLSYDPSLTDRALLDSYEAWVEGNFKTCGRIQESEHSVVEYFVKPIFPCSLVIRGDAAPIEYDNGMELGHLVHEFVDEKLDTFMVWSRLPSDNHGASIQIFDKDNVKVLGDDFVISHAPLAYHRIDLSSLPSGEYVAKMILYNFETRVSVPGTVTSSDTRFKREFEFARLTID